MAVDDAAIRDCMLKIMQNSWNAESEELGELNILTIRTLASEEVEVK
jgi:hypothetical protein